MSASWEVLIVILWITVLVLGVLILGLIRRVAPLLAEEHESHSELQPQGLSPGAEVPVFQAKDGIGRVVDSRELTPIGRIFVFVAPGCPPCDELLRQLGHSFDSIATPVFLVLDETSNSGEWTAPGGVEVLYEIDGSIAKAFRNSAAPYAFAVGKSGRVVESRIVNFASELRDLADRIVKDDESAGAAGALDPAENLTLVRGGV